MKPRGKRRLNATSVKLIYDKKEELNKHNEMRAKRRLSIRAANKLINVHGIL